MVLDNSNYNIQNNNNIKKNKIINDNGFILLDNENSKIKNYYLCPKNRYIWALYNNDNHINFIKPASNIYNYIAIINNLSDTNYNNQPEKFEIKI